MKLHITPLSELFKDLPRRRTVLIVEPNPYHGELLPGFTYLFQKLGYRVHLLVREEMVKENPFALYPQSKSPKIFSGSAQDMKDALQQPVIKGYEFVFFSTNVYWEKDVNQSSYAAYLDFSPSGKHGSVYIEHNLTYLDEDDARELYDEGRVFTLLPYSFEERTTKMLNPHYFGKVAKSRRAHKKRQILIIGSSSRDPVNLSYLYTSLRQLIADGERDFHLSVVGEAIEIPTDLKKYMTVLGRLNFHDYYKAVEAHDYLLTLIDLESDDIIHTKYSHGTTSGTVQISLGFAKPMIIDDRHADVYGFSHRDAIVYGPNKLTAALVKAIHITDKDYQDLTRALDKKADQVERASVRNLQAVVRHLGVYNQPNRLDIVTGQQTKKVLARIPGRYKRLPAKIIRSFSKRNAE